MVFEASVSSLTEELIVLTTNITPNDPRKIDHLKQSALQTFSDSCLRITNQFDVNARLSGLEEKFRILNNDELADALHTRLVELSLKGDRWLPEALYLLLQFSDNPVENSKIEDLESLKPEPIPAPPSWADILAEDPLDNRDGIWDSVDFTADGSDDDDILLEGSSPSGSNSDHGTKTDNLDTIANDLVVVTDDQLLSEIANAQFWKKEEFLREHGQDHDMVCNGDQSITVTEAQLIREVIFMLLGLPTSVYKCNSRGSLIPSVICNIEHMSQDSVNNLLDNFAKIGDDLANIRAWVEKDETIPLHQTFQAALAARTDNMNVAFSEIQARFLDPSKNLSISLLKIFDEISRITSFTQQIAEITRTINSESIEKMSFRILELLYNRTCMNHCIGDVDGYVNMAVLFFECFHTYLKPIILWMEYGELSKHDQVFFVKEDTEEVTSESLWQKNYHLVNDANGFLYAPRFLHTAARKIFSIGKSVNILKRIGQKTKPSGICKTESQHLDYKSVCQKGNLDTLSPFSELFNVALEKWITSMHLASSQVLRHHLESQCGLERHLDALEIVYFSRNGALSGVISRTIFDRIDQGLEAWNDGFLLTELFQGVYRKLPCIDTNRLAVRPSTGSYQDIRSMRRSVKVLGSLRIWYSLPWPITNIIKQDSIRIYQRIFIFEAQTQRTKYMLERLHLSHSILPALDSEHRENHLIYSLRHRLLWFTNSLLTYLTDVVLSVQNTEMRIKMKEAEDMDAMIAVHQAFVSKLESQCLISKNLAPIYQAIISLLDLVILFSDTHASFTGQSTLALTNPSVIPTPSHHPSFNQRFRKESTNLDSSSSSSSDNESPETDVSYISFADIPYAQRLTNMHASFSRLLAFIVAGLQGVHRAGGEPCWEILADGLAAGIGRRERVGG